MILEEIAEKTKIRVEQAKKNVPLEKMRQLAQEKNAQTGFPFERELAKPKISFICEVKKASPSKGLIAEEFDYLSIAKEYEMAGAGAISVSIPILRKDFTVDEYMIYEAKAAGADAVLLICAILEREQLKHYIEICDSLGLSALVEAHDADEIEKAVFAGARIIGVNNRNLKDFTVDIHNGIRLREQVPERIRFVAESGIQTRADIVELEKGKVDAVLIGETLMKSADKGQKLRELNGGAIENAKN